MKKRIILLLFCFILLLSMTGCSGNGGDKGEIPPLNEKNESSMSGCYMENEMELPQMGRMGMEENKISGACYSKKGGIEVYSTYLNVNYFCYSLSEEWNKVSASWLNSIEELKYDGTALGVQEGEDGFKYVLIHTNEGKKEELSIYRTKDGGMTSEKVETPYLKNKINDFRVLEDGSIVIDNGVNNTLKIYSGTDGKEIGSIKFGNKLAKNVGFGVNGSKIITVDEGGKGIIVYDTKKVQVERTINYDFEEHSQIQFAMSDNGNIYAADKKGIHRMQPNGTLWETIIEGDDCFLGSARTSFDNLIVDAKEGELEKYYIFTHDKVYQYAYDENIKAASKKVISIYALNGVPAMQEWILAYRKNNPEVRINYIEAKGREEILNPTMAMEDSEYIRALNTEILAGKGPDILLLDGLPIESYIEKGVLADISGFINPLIEDGTFMKNIGEAYKKEDKIYHMPMFFEMPIIIGDQNAITSGGSLEDIVDYIKKNPEIPFLKDITNEELIKQMLFLEIDNLREKGTLDKQEVIKFLENLKIVSENVYKDSQCQCDRPWNCKCFFWNLMDKKCKVNYQKMQGISDLNQLVFTGTQTGAQYSSINKAFVPRFSLGLNTSSKEKETALDFMKFLYSKEFWSYQISDSNTGLSIYPTNEEALTEALTPEYRVVDLIPENSEHEEYRIFQASYEERMKFLDMFKELNKPILIENTLQDMILEPSLKYLSGSISLEQAAEMIVSKVNTYLAE